jgi:hypothetical protein
MHRPVGPSAEGYVSLEAQPQDPSDHLSLRTADGPSTARETTAISTSLSLAASCTPRVPLHQRGHLLDERLARASWLVASETADSQMDDNLAVGQG